jgi:hypothetical protein
MSRLVLILKNLFSESGDVSMMRVMSLMSTLTACGIAINAVLNNRDLVGTAAIVGTLVGAAFAGKVMQKGKEE